jgi:flavin reductase (DIM6/NTAB) family NADH-FMN oxidoreductase RutF
MIESQDSGCASSRPPVASGVHRVIEPKIMYFGTPVVLISTLNEDGTENLAPMSSAWWLGQSCMLGLGTRSKTAQNLQREGECVLNLPSSQMVEAVDRLACTTGSDPMPKYKRGMGFEFVKHKFKHAGLTPIASELVKPSRVLECPVHLEAVVENTHEFGRDSAAAIEVRIVRAYFEESILSTEKRHHVDTDKWHPLIMSFCEFYGLGENVHPSRLAKVF